MIKEELEKATDKESYKYNKKYSEDYKLKDMLTRPMDFIEGAIEDVVKLLKIKAYRDGYLAGAEPREKRIVELEAQIEKMQEKLKADLIARLQEQMQYSTSPSCTKGMELFIRSIEEWEIKENVAHRPTSLDKSDIDRELRAQVVRME